MGKNDKKSGTIKNPYDVYGKPRKDMSAGSVTPGVNKSNAARNAPRMVDSGVVGPDNKRIMIPESVSHYLGYSGNVKPVSIPKKVPVEKKFYEKPEEMDEFEKILMGYDDAPYGRGLGQYVPGQEPDPEVPYGKGLGQYVPGQEPETEVPYGKGLGQYVPGQEPGPVYNAHSYYKNMFKSTEKQKKDIDAFNLEYGAYGKVEAPDPFDNIFDEEYGVKPQARDKNYSAPNIAQHREPDDFDGIVDEFGIGKNEIYVDTDTYRQLEDMSAINGIKNIGMLGGDVRPLMELEAEKRYNKLFKKNISEEAYTNIKDMLGDVPSAQKLLKKAKDELKDKELHIDKNGELQVNLNGGWVTCKNKSMITFVNLVEESLPGVRLSENGSQIIMGGNPYEIQGAPPGGPIFDVAWKELKSYTKTIRSFDPGGISNLDIIGPDGAISSVAGALSIAITAMKVSLESIKVVDYKTTFYVAYEGTPYERRKAVIQVGSGKDVYAKTEYNKKMGTYSIMMDPLNQYIVKYRLSEDYVNQMFMGVIAVDKYGRAVFEPYKYYVEATVIYSDGTSRDVSGYY